MKILGGITSGDFSDTEVFDFCKASKVTINMPESTMWTLDGEAVEGSKVTVIDFESKPPMYDKKYDTCQVRAIISTNANTENGALKAYMLFNVIKDNDGFWRINSFKSTDANFE